jgi:hypothetical protein
VSGEKFTNYITFPFLLPLVLPLLRTQFGKVNRQTHWYLIGSLCLLRFSILFLNIILTQAVGMCLIHAP